MKNNLPESPIRTLAKSYYWQSIFARSKEIPGSVRLFENKSDFTKLQLLFLQQLEIVSGLYQDLAMGEDLISEEVVNDELRSEAYLLYRKNKRDQERSNKNINNQTPPGVTTNPNKERIVLTSSRGQK